ncbi:unnamed protein product, partial [marine sediment metagenome]
KNNFREASISCAFREFREETRLSLDHVQIIQEDQPYVETFQGSNGKTYCTYYYLAQFPRLLESHKIGTPHCIRDETVSEEASNVCWFSLEDACSLLNPQRQGFLKDADSIISSLNPQV